MGQLTFAEVEYEVKKRNTRRDKFLERMDSLLPWKKLERQLAKKYSADRVGGKPLVNRLVILLLALLCATPVIAKGSGSDDDANSFSVMPYLWAAQFNGKGGDGDSEGDSTGNEIFSDLSLGGFMLFSEYRHRSRWKVFGDWTYAKVTSDANVSIGRFLKTGGEVELKGHIVQGAVGYEVFKNATSFADVFAGVRYLNINTKVDAKTGFLAGFKVDGSAQWADGIIGVKGSKELSEKWHMSLYGDVGGGGSDFTWQALGLLAYGFGWGHLNAGWRHLYVDYDSGGLKLDAYLTGPFIGAQFDF